jgi:hypothetical protein
MIEEMLPCGAAGNSSRGGSSHHKADVTLVIDHGHLRYFGKKGIGVRS